jgi:hypothetical protein
MPQLPNLDNDTTWVEDPGPLDDTPEEEAAWQREGTNKLRAKLGLPPLEEPAS